MKFLNISLSILIIILLIVFFQSKKKAKNEEKQLDEEARRLDAEIVLIKERQDAIASMDIAATMTGLLRKLLVDDNSINN